MSATTTRLINNYESLPTAEKRRDFLVDNYFIPLAKEMFNFDKRINVVYLAFAQYFNDEADDAVHYTLIPSSIYGWEKCFTESNVLAERNDPADEWYVDTWDMLHKAYDVITEGSSLYLSNNELFISDFSPYCKEGQDQCGNTFETYLPYAYVRTGDPNVNEGEFVIKMIGDIVRILK